MDEWTLKRIKKLEDEMTDLRTRIETPIATSYNPTWTAASANPAIGSGTITGAYVRRGPLCRFWFSIIMAANTTFGTGAWRFSLPIAAYTGVLTHRYIGTKYIYDSNTTILHTGLAVIDPNFPNDIRYMFADHDTTATMDANTPIVWATSDVLYVDVEYRIA